MTAFLPGKRVDGWANFFNASRLPLDAREGAPGVGYPGGALVVTRAKRGMAGKFSREARKFLAAAKWPKVSGFAGWFWKFSREARKFMLPRSGQK